MVIKIRPRAASPARRASWRQGWRADALGLLGVLAIVLLFGYRLLGPTTTVPGDVLLEIKPWNTILSGTQHNWLLSDPILQMYPYRTFINAQLQQGVLPLWNPYIFSGQPVVADPNINLFYPFTLALGWLSPGNATDLYILIHLLITALGMYTLLRVWGGSPLGGIVAAAVFCGCSALTVWQQYNNLLGTGSWLPWLLVCFQMAQRGRRWLWLSCGGTVLGLILLANFIQWTVYDLLLLGSYAAWLSVGALLRRSWRQALAPLLDVAVICAIGLGLGMVQLLPLFELATQSSRGTRSPHLYQFLVGGALPSLKLLTAIAPNFFGTPLLRGSDWGPAINYAEGTLFWGVYPLLLAITAPLWRRDRTVWFMWAFLLLVASIAIGLPTLYLIMPLPGLNVFAPARLIYLICFCGAVLAGLTLPMLWHGRRRWLPLAVLGGLALVARAGLHLVLLRSLAELPAQLGPLQADLRWVTWLLVVDAAIFGLALLRWRYAPLLAQTALALLIIVDVARFSLPYNSYTSSERTLFPRPESLKQLPASDLPPRLAVVHHGDLLLLPNLLMVYGIAQVGGYSSLAPDPYRDFVSRLDSGFAQSPFAKNLNVVTLNSYSPLLARLFGTEYVASAQPLNAAELELIADQQSLFVYRSTVPTPRAFIVADTRAVADLDGAIQAIAAPGYDVCRFATVRAAQPVVTGGDVDGCVGSATIAEYTPNAVRIRAETPVDGLLVLSDAYYPGWRVTADGVEQPIVQANGVFRGVRLSAGQHEVQFSFRPQRVIVGGMLSLATLLLVVLVIGWELWRFRRSASSTS